MRRSYYSDCIPDFRDCSEDTILGILVGQAEFSVEQTQRDAWISQIRILKETLSGYEGRIHFEYAIPRMGRRIDVLLLIGSVIIVLEFKVGEKEFTAQGLDQVWDYALDLKNFHETSHERYVAPILVATEAEDVAPAAVLTPQNDRLFDPVRTNVNLLGNVMESILSFAGGEKIDPAQWEAGRYCPTPTIIEAAMALYNDHTVTDISRSDASAKNLSQTSDEIAAIIRNSRERSRKTICFVTGVPGAGKTLVGLNVATKHIDKNDDLYSVFLSGNGPLVKVLREALVRDKVRREREKGRRITKSVALSEVKMFIQNIHHFRDEYIRDEGPPVDHVALFDEAQRAWNLEQTSSFMRRKKNLPDFDQSEPEFLISCLDRHPDWAVIVCLVGGGQEINTGNVSLLVKQVLDLDLKGARETLDCVRGKYPIAITRDLQIAKRWLKTKARGSERYGIVVSSQAERLKPHAIDVKSPMDPVHWFLDGKDDVRSSYYLEDVATEFHVQGLELDWSCVSWDADYRYSANGWKHRSFRGSRWERISKGERKIYQKNAYRVLLTRARQGMVIVPPGSCDDSTRDPAFYDPTFDYLREIGFPVLG